MITIVSVFFISLLGVQVQRDMLAAMETEDNLELPNTFWRVSVKALIFDEFNRLLVFMGKRNEWQMPGGGLEHSESYEDCVKREIFEEIKVNVTNVEHVLFAYQGKTSKGYPKISLAVKATIDDSPITPFDEDILDAKFVTKEEFLALPFKPGEDTIKNFTAQIWD